MPHIIVKLYPGRTEEQKKKLADKITQAVIEAVNVPDDSISIGIEEIPKEQWDEAVKKPDIIAKQKTLYKHSQSSKVV
ncbi:MAG TPA: 4-oxalocrotonate tautomerase family protein [Chitinivibrionales bacterium]